MREQTYDVVLRIDAGLRASDWRESRSAGVELIYDSSRQDSQIPVERLRTALEQYSRTVGVLRVIDRGISPQVAQPMQRGAARRRHAGGQARHGARRVLPYLLILSAFLGGAYLVIDVTAGERERQSLEPLLATPARAQRDHERQDPRRLPVRHAQPGC